MTPLQAKSMALLNLQRREANDAERERQGDQLRAMLITDDEVENIFTALLRSRVAENRGTTTEELQQMVNTIIAERYAAGLSEMAGKGLMDIKFDPTKPYGQQIEYDIRADMEPEVREELLRRANEARAKTAQPR